MLKTRIMYIEHKEDLTGNARIGRVTFSKTGKSIHFDGKTFQTLNGSGFKENYFDVETGDYYWISGCKKDGGDRLYGERKPIYIDEDTREEYWIEIRNLPNQVDKKVINGN
ncbi:1-deoxy-D-xylulose-5-phosphate synthase [Pedobacter frigiditerrae]|uniref:1-deoxy-D-xylulose-5-phosphate synthase n=1 Tax=Pedobacter frigiditerrae TaxID=2530452 RepID=A0A4R0MN53_9SPHI|nr:1-deoxy-D-xylulose-5-phosphate synthase [Pedobacter frigiditerrae]TCC88175.1 1-deoxy-D-xylulose-5-phosphate synthase [Pedobacter frigiditerrae]